MNESLLAEQARIARLMKRKRGLEVELEKLKENVNTAVSAERVKWEEKIVNLQNQLLSQEETLKAVWEMSAGFEQREVEASKSFTSSSR